MVLVGLLLSSSNYNLFSKIKAFGGFSESLFTWKKGVTEQLKVQNQMRWVKRMNNIRERAEEIVREEIIYCL